MPTETRSRRRRRRRRGHGNIESILPTALVGVTAVLAPQLIGGVHGASISIIATLSGASCIAVTWLASRRKVTPARHAVLLVSIAAVLFTAITVVVLPRGVVSILQPDAVSMADDATQLLGEPDRTWVALSLSPGSTRSELVRHAGLLAALLAGILLVSLGKRRAVIMSVGASVTVMAIVVIAHQVLLLDRVFGVYEPYLLNTDLIAPLLNQNHLSGFLAMGVPVLLGLALDEEADSRARLGMGAAAFVAAGVSLAALSRGGVASLAVGIAGLAMLVVTHRLREKGGRRSGPLTAQIVVGLLLTVGAAVAAYLLAPWALEAIEASDVDKVAIAADAFAVAVDHPFLGVGRGAFDTAFVSQYAGLGRAEFPENLLVQWGSEWGLPLTVALLFALGSATLRAFRDARSTPQLGALAGVVSIFTHDLVDFSLELAGVSTVAVLLLAAAVTPSPSTSSSSSRSSGSPATDTKPVPARVPSARLGWVVGVAAVILGALVGPTLDGIQVVSLQRELTGLIESGDQTRFRERVRTAVRLHPAEPVFVLLGGAEAARRGDPSAVPWLNHAMRLAPHWGSPHVEAARYLARIGRIDQAYLELREAATRELVRPDLACTLLSERPDSVEALLRAAGDDAVGIRLLDRSTACLQDDLPAVRTVDAHLVAQRHVPAVLREARRALRAGDPDEAARLLDRVEGSPDEVVLMRAEVAIAGGDPDRAASLLSAHRFSVSNANQQALRVLAQAHAAAQREAPMRETTEQMRRLVAGSAAQLAEIWLFEGGLEEGLENYDEAFAAYQSAHRIAPDSAGLEREAHLAHRLNLTHRAQRAYESLCRLRGPESGACATLSDTRTNAP